MWLLEGIVLTRRFLLPRVKCSRVYAIGVVGSLQWKAFKVFKENRIQLFKRSMSSEHVCTLFQAELQGLASKELSAPVSSIVNEPVTLEFLDLNPTLGLREIFKQETKAMTLSGFCPQHQVFREILPLTLEVQFSCHG